MNKRNQRPYRKREDRSKHYNVKEKDELLTFLVANVTHLSRNSIKNLLKNKKIAVNGVPTTQYNFVLVKEDVVTVLDRKSSLKLTMKLKVIYEDEDLIAIEKPHDLLSVPSDDLNKENVYQILTKYVQQNDRRKRIYVIHRLDEGTSGIMLVAKSVKMRNLLQKNWNEFVIKRQYHAVVEGIVKAKSATLKHHLAENKFNLMYVTLNTNIGKESITKYEVVKTGKTLSLLEVEILTGRKNQIRVQLGYIGHHVIGDNKYGNPPNPFKRLGLHASELVIFHPIKKQRMSFKSPVPKRFYQI